MRSQKAEGLLRLALPFQLGSDTGWMKGNLRTRQVMLFLAVVSFWSHARGQEAQPPILLSPYNQSDVSERFVTWSWFMQAKTARGEDVICDLRVVEVLDHQTPEEAFRNNPVVLEKENLRTTIWQAALGTRSLLSGHRYAWKITAHIGSRIVSESEIWTFTFSDPLTADSIRTAPGPAAPNPVVPQAVPQETTPSGSGQARQTGIVVAGKARSTAQSANVPGDLSGTPAEFLRIQIDPTLTVNGAPLELSFLVTTEKNSSQSTINRGTFGYQRGAGGLNLGLQQRIGEAPVDAPRRRSEVLHDSLRLLRQDTLGFDRELREREARLGADTLKRLEEQPTGPGVLLDIPAFGFGAVAPRFTDFSLNAVTLNGGFVEYNPGRFYVEGVLGKIERQVDLSTVPPAAAVGATEGAAPKFFANLYGARVGYGQKEGGNIILSLLYARDDEQSRLLEHLLDSSQAFIAPQENFVLGLSGQNRFDDIGLLVSGEADVSLLTEQLNGRAPRETRMRSLARALFGGNNVRDQSIGDIAYSFKAAKLLFESHAIASADVRMVGPSYRSIGTVNLRSDIFGYDLGYNHQFLESRLVVGGTYGFEKTGFVLNDSSTARVQKLGLSALFRPRSLPSLGLSFSDNRQDQQNPGGLGSRISLIRIFDATSRYPARIGSLRTVSAISYTFQKGTSDDGVSTFTSNRVNLTTSVAFAFPLTAMLSVTHAHTTALVDTSQQSPAFSLVFSLLHQTSDIWENTAGITYSRELEQRGRGVFLSSTLNLAERGSVEFRWEYTEFRNDPLRTQGSVDRILQLIARLGFG